ncbi:MAG: T9SS type A sorting domain-containing protein [Bacteroidales bacterium]|nr:T9SS type A sorting domain-containing protein [Bacteroidales bacterium]
MKKFIIFFLSILFLVNVNAQYFNWAKTYMGSEEAFATPSTMTNRIYHSEFDSQGNIYILGSFGQGASFNDTDILGVAFGGATTSIVVMKLDPDGNLIWKKAIKNGNNISIYPNWMKLVGDTSIVVVTNMSLGTSDIDLWYLDTLITTGLNDPQPEYPFHFYNNMSPLANAFITFDLNGNVISQHFLQIASVDSSGVEIDDNWFAENGVTSPFHIDNSGNIYICSQFRKLYPPQSNCTSESFRLVIDGVRTIDFGMKYRQNSKIFKFSPNFNELIWSKDLMADTTEVGKDTLRILHTPLITGISSDSIGNIYVCGYIYHDRNYYPGGDTLYNKTIYVDTNNRNFTIDIEPAAGNVGFLIKYDTSGNVLWTNQLHGYTQFAGNESHGYVLGFGSWFHNLAINEDNNSVYVLALIYAGGIDTNSYLMFNDTVTYKSMWGDISFIRYNKDNGEYLSHGLANSEGERGTFTNIDYGFGTTPFIVRNNQVFAQVIYGNSIVGFDTVIRSLDSSFNGAGLALVRWREDGGLIEVIDYPINSQAARMVSGGTAMNNQGDIVVFGCADNEISFGPYTVGQGTAGNSRAFIAKYSDPSFNQYYDGDVYFYVPDTIPDTSNLISDIEFRHEIFVYPNPTKGDVYIITQGEKINSFSLYNTNGQLLLKNEKLKTTNEKINFSAFSKGVYIIKIITDNNVYSKKIIVN